MLVFVCETVTGGDFVGTSLPSSLIAEGTLMRDTLIGDLEDLPGVRVVTTHDARLPAPPRGDSTSIDENDDRRAIWAALAGEAHCVWPIAPETDGVLENLVGFFATHSRRVIAPDVETLRICASKTETAAVLAEAGVPIVPTLNFEDVPPGAPGPFVIKPDDGAGAIDVAIHERMPAAPYPAGSILQPLIAGTPASLVILCQSGRTHVLCASRQHVEPFDGHLRFSGVTVGALPVTDQLRDIAGRIGEALPGLHGICGVDYIETIEGPLVIEINPRLTTSYAGLRASLGVNPLAFVAELIRDGEVPDLPHLPRALPVEVLV